MSGARVNPPHAHYREDHLLHVVREMRRRGPPVIRASFDGKTWHAREGTHRLRAAKILGVAPVLVPVRWDKTRAALERAKHGATRNAHVFELVEVRGRVAEAPERGKTERIPAPWLVLIAHLNGTPLDGTDGVRDVRAPCDAFARGEPGGGACETDGHYFCAECAEISPRALLRRQDRCEDCGARLTFREPGTYPDPCRACDSSGAR